MRGISQYFSARRVRAGIAAEQAAEEAAMSQARADITLVIEIVRRIPARDIRAEGGRYWYREGGEWHRIGLAGLAEIAGLGERKGGLCYPGAEPQIGDR